VPYKPPQPLELHHQLDQFGCEEPELTEWLQRYARQAHAAGSARVYVTTTNDDVDRVVGYYALSAASVAPADASGRTLKGVPKAQAVPAILLARLARDVGHKGRGLGPSLLQDALARSSEAASVIGARVVLVHAKHARARAFYLEHGFEESPTDPLHLMLLMKDVRRYLAQRSTSG